MSADAEKLRAALEQAAAEQQRRIRDKIEKGTAVLSSDVVVVSGDVSTSIERDADGRETYYVAERDADGREIYSHEPVRIITGVPRCAPEDRHQGDVLEKEPQHRGPQGEALRLPEGNPLRANYAPPPPET